MSSRGREGLCDRDRPAHVAVRAAAIIDGAAAVEGQAGAVAASQQAGVECITCVVPRAVARAIFVDPCDRVTDGYGQVRRRKCHVLDGNGMGCCACSSGS